MEVVLAVSGVGLLLVELFVELVAGGVEFCLFLTGLFEVDLDSEVASWFVLTVCTPSTCGFCSGFRASVAQPGLNKYAPVTSADKGNTIIVILAVVERLIARQRLPVSSKKIILLL